MNKISVIIPCYNVEAYIDRCMASIEAQTIGMENLEVICIDDASADNTWDRLKDWEQSFPKQVLLIRQAVNARQGTARNLGLQYASADWITYVDADDWLEPDYLEKLYQPVEHLNCDVVCCGWKRDASALLTYFDQESRSAIAEEAQYIVADAEKKYISKQILRFKKLGQAPYAKIIRKRLLTDFQVYFPEGLAYEDHYWTPLLHIYASRIYIVNENLYHYFVNPCSTSHSADPEYLLDWVTVQMMKWNDYRKRGILEEYWDELVHDALRDAWGFLLWTIMKYEEPPFSFFQLEREFIREQVPDYRSDPYIMDFAELYRLLLDMLYSPINKAEFHHLSEQIKEQWSLL